MFRTSWDGQQESRCGDAPCTLRTERRAGRRGPLWRAGGWAGREQRTSKMSGSLVVVGGRGGATRVDCKASLALADASGGHPSHRSSLTSPPPVSTRIIVSTVLLCLLPLQLCLSLTLFTDLSTASIAPKTVISQPTAVLCKVCCIPRTCHDS